MTQPRENVHTNFGGECFPEDISPYILMPTDAHHVEMIISHWQKAKKITHHYEYLIYTGEYFGMPISVCSTGLGGVSVATAVEEFAKMGAHTFINIGLANPVIGNPKLGELSISTGAVRYDGTSLDYVRPEYPAIANHNLVIASISAAEKHDLNYKVGITASFAGSTSNPSSKFGHFLENRMAPKIFELEKAGVLSGNGEEATLFVQSSVYGLRAGSITVCALDEKTNKINTSVEENGIKVGIDAMYAISKWDTE